MTYSPSSWDDRYSKDEFYYGREPNDFLREHCSEIASGGRVLCLAEGEGRNAVFLAKQGYQVTAVDGSMKGLEKLAMFAKSQGVSVETVHADLNDFSLGIKKWDGIVSIWCHLPPALRKKVHSESVIALKPKGVFLLEAYRPEQLSFKTGGPPTADMMTQLSELLEQFGEMEMKIARETVREIHEGAGHEGMSAVVQFLAVRTKLVNL